MPIYNLSEPSGALTAVKKQALAQAITEVHCGVTGAKPELVNVYIQEFGDDDVYVAGQTSRQYLVHGLIRAGRDEAGHKAILLGISRRTAEIAGVDEAKVGVAIEDIDASHASEGGKILPQAHQS